MTRTVAHANPPLITITDCSIVLDGERALDDATFTLRAGERWALVGPNGSGKTLLLKLMCGAMWPTPTGRERVAYSFDGEISERPFAAMERVSYVGPERQDRYTRLEWNHSVTAIITTGLFDEDIPRARPTGLQRKRVERLLRQFGLWSLRERGFLTLSYGQRRRTLIARAFAKRPQVLLLDEVFNGLDSSSAGILRRALRDNKQSSTWIVTAHRAEDVPDNATHIATMRKGKVISAVPIDVANAVVRLKVSSRKLSNSSLLNENREHTKSKSNTLIRLRDVELYRDYRMVLRNVNWKIGAGEHWAIVGRNGSGKSTLLKLLYGDLHPRLGGEIERDGFLAGTPISEWKRRVGFLSPELQADYFVARDLTEVVMSGRYSSVGLNDAPTRADIAAAQKWIRFFGIDSIAHRRPRAVSYGQLRLTLLARAMINRPKLLLLDEPCTGLDPDVRAMILEVLARLAKQGVQLVMAVHELADLPACVKRVLEIRKDKRVDIRDLNH